MQRPDVETSAAPSAPPSRPSRGPTRLQGSIPSRSALHRAAAGHDRLLRASVRGLLVGQTPTFTHMSGNSHRLTWTW
ncbi:hypothetical protein AKJ08_2607 [Vulgatibacter incomptus]|uniref:Uncharacterized protein n=1 Tax=Vulgatibacter incomptus TaxID=1391653 RepID=A0A0K1PFD5_9BACT|nr:hypothetical protein AKJ08_2607 [Vulgatibacter incomptus]